MIAAAERDALHDEARRFAAALPGAVADDYVASQYARAHQHLDLAPRSPVDDLLLTFAAEGPLALRAADAYARFFAPRSILRRKLTVLVAILESASPGDQAFAAASRAAPAVAAELVLAGAGFGLLLVAGTLALAPWHLAARLVGDR